MFTAVGHQKQKEFLQLLLEKKQYSHAYLFTGPSEIGKRTIAVEFGMNLLEISTAKTASEFWHPDLIQIDASALAIADMRELIDTLSLAPFSAKKKVVIIDNFELASREVSNALLKTLEEPNNTTIIILIAENYKALLPTIISRTQRIHFGALSYLEIAKEFPQITNPEKLNGKPGRAMRITADPAYDLRYKSSATQLAEIKNTPKAERLLVIKKLAELEDNDLTEMIRWWCESEQSELNLQPHLFSNLKAYVAGLSGINRNFNKKLILQKILLEIIP